VAPGVERIDWAAPWLQPWKTRGESLAAALQAAGVPVHAALSAAPAPVRFVPQSDLPEGQAYEQFIWDTRCVPTRDNLHDFFNGLVWLEFPKAKRRINELQAQAIAQDGVGAVRGPLRDALTVFDENGALLQAPAGRVVDVLLLDIHMPGPDGLALAQSLQQLPQPPAVVFVTAHSHHALAAFELDAVDYLTKPVRLARLQQALAKVQRSGHGTAFASAPTPTPALSAALPESAAPPLLVYDRGQVQRIPMHELLYLKAEQKYITVRTLQHVYVMDGTLNDLLAAHSPHLLRIHRNALVARHAIRALEKLSDSAQGIHGAQGIESEGWALRLQGLSDWLPVSRRQVNAVRQALAQGSGE